MGMIRSWLKTAATPTPAEQARPAVGPADAWLFGAVITLIAFGVVMVYSASAVFASQQFDDAYFFLKRQGVFALVALPLMLVLARVDYHRYRALTYPLLAGVGVLMCAVVLGLGHTAGGATRWIAIGPIHVQPAEMAKVALIFWLAYSLSKKREKIKSFSVGFLPHVLMAGALMLLCLRQPDFGSAVMIGLLTFVLLFTAGAKLGYILGACLAAAPIVYGLIVSSPMRKRRVLGFLRPFETRLDEGYQLWEAFLSYGSGGLTGVGIGDSRQKLFYLPEAHTDFISAIIAEELGFLGVALVIALFVIVCVRGLRAAFRAGDEYGAFLAVGITMFVGVQAFTNLAVVMGMLPTKGLALPFLSYGGSSLLVNAAAVGVLLNISRSRVPEDAAAQGTRGTGRAKPALAFAGGTA